MNRRDFLKTSLGLLGTHSFMGMPGFLARAQDLAQGDKTLVVIQLSGGNDGLNTLIPFNYDAYYAARPNLAIKKKEVIPVSPDLGMHPNLRDLSKFFENGQLAWLNNVGYPNPNRSHFASMAIWHTADPEQAQKDGWIGRIAEQIGDPFCASNIGVYTPYALRKQDSSLPSFNNIDDFKLEIKEDLQTSYQTMLDHTRQGQAAYVQQSIKQMLENSHIIQAALGNYQQAVNYPQSELGKRLQQVAKLIATRLGQRVLYVSLGGFDTHAHQRQEHDALMLELSQALVAFYDDLEMQGLAENVVVLGFSEFGRRVAENASEGTDHGQGSVMFALGKEIQGGVYGNVADLENLADGDIRYQQDFRGVYSKVLDKWLNISSQDILGGSFDGPDFV